ncbi:potassium channel family protein [Salinigranum halophilum]|uniref:potassium channel family protein n=1 Tax=Salinigranum halophilum TaxID=2565931 RepID=UPI0010A949EA
MDVSSDSLDTSAGRPLVRRATRPLTAFAGVVVAGVVGFTVLGGVGVVDALFWLVDPTSIELHFREHAGPERLVKAYAVLVVSGLVLAGLWTGETVLAAAFGGQMTEELKRMQNDRAIADLDDHVIICGYGMFGRTIVDSLRSADRDVVVVEMDETQYERALATEGVLAVNADARREETLVDAGVRRADTVVAAIDDSNVNIQLSIAASQLAPEVTLVVRVGEEMYESLARRAGADEVVIPEVVSGRQVIESL